MTHDSEVPKTHPHNLVSPASVGRDGCKKGVCTMNVNNEEMSVEFPHLGIQVLHCTVLYCTVLYCTVLYCTVLYCIVLY